MIFKSWLESEKKRERCGRKGERDRKKSKYENVNEREGGREEKGKKEGRERGRKRGRRRQSTESLDQESSTLCKHSNNRSSLDNSGV